MSMQDPISDMLTRIRNALLSKKNIVKMPFSNEKAAIAKLLFNEGYIKEYSSYDFKKNIKILEVYLKYYNGCSVISSLKRISRPGLRIYRKYNNLPIVKGGFGVSVISTSKGLFVDYKARSLGIGGEVICFVS